MKTLTPLIISTLISGISCTTPAPVVSELGINSSTIRLGFERDGRFIPKTDKSFFNSDKIILKFKANGLAVKNGQVKVNIDLFLKKDNNILGAENDIWGKDGLSETVTGTSVESDLELGIIPPSETKGEIIANLTLKDLNSTAKFVSFQTSFILK